MKNDAKKFVVGDKITRKNPYDDNETTYEVLSVNAGNKNHPTGQVIIQAGWYNEAYDKVCHKTYPPADIIIEQDGSQSVRVKDKSGFLQAYLYAVEKNLTAPEHDTPSATRGDYSPSAPWNAPGMSVRDFI